MLPEIQTQHQETLTMQFSFQATNAQVKAFECMCQVNEHVLAGTLAKRLEQAPQNEWEELIRSWFSTVRQMGIAAHVLNGIKLERIEPVVHFMHGGHTACSKPGVPGKDWELNHYHSPNWDLVNCPICLQHKP